MDVTNVYRVTLNTKCKLCEKSTLLIGYTKSRSEDMYIDLDAYKMLCDKCGFGVTYINDTLCVGMLDGLNYAVNRFLFADKIQYYMDNHISWVGNDIGKAIIAWDLMDDTIQQRYQMSDETSAKK